MESKPKKDLIRIVRSENKVEIDLSGKANGRGVYLCRNADCFLKAKKKKAIQRGLEAELSETAWNALFEELSAYERKDN